MEVRSGRRGGSALGGIDRGCAYGQVFSRISVWDVKLRTQPSTP